MSKSNHSRETMDDLFATADQNFHPYVAPFSQSLDFLFATPTSMIHNPKLLPHKVPATDTNNHLPPQKLRPVRGNCLPDEADGLDGNVDGSENVGSAFLNNDLCAMNAACTDYLTPEKQMEAGDRNRLQVEVGREFDGGGDEADGCYRVSGPVKNRWGHGGDSGDPNGHGSCFKDNVSFYSETDGDSSVNSKERVSRKKGKKSRKKITDFMENLTMKVMERQEEMHKHLIALIEKKERDRLMREAAWRQQGMERMRLEEQTRTQETSRNLGLIAFIQILLGTEIQIPRPVSTHFAEANSAELEIHNNPRTGTVNNRCQQEAENEVIEIEKPKGDPFNTRWPDTEVLTLIALRTSWEHKSNIMGPKGSIWVEISGAMLSMGYHRNAKKCKEKWESINKYYKRTIVCGKQRRLNSKTCPYFDELDVLYKNGLLSLGNVFSNVVKTENDSI